MVREWISYIVTDGRRPSMAVVEELLREAGPAYRIRNHFLAHGQSLLGVIGARLLDDLGLEELRMTVECAGQPEAHRGPVLRLLEKKARAVVEVQTPIPTPPPC